MPFPFIYLAGAAALGYAGFALAKDRIPYGTLTPERQVIFESALANLRDPVALRKLADLYQKHGLSPQADMLRKRAAIREMSPEKKAERRAIYRQAMNSMDADGIEGVAKAFENEGATGAADNLRFYIEALREAEKAKLGRPAVVIPPPSEFAGRRRRRGQNPAQGGSPQAVSVNAPPGAGDAAGGGGGGGAPDAGGGGDGGAGAPQGGDGS